MDSLENLRANILKYILESEDEASLENIRIKYLGKKGQISLKMRELGSMPQELR